MSPLNLKLLRDASRMKGQMFAVGIVMACGLAMMIMARSLIFSLESTRDAYYERNRFADVFSGLKRAPNALRSRHAEFVQESMDIGARMKAGFAGNRAAWLAGAAFTGVLLSHFTRWKILIPLPLTSNRFTPSNTSISISS